MITMKIKQRQIWKFIWILLCVAVLFFHFGQCFEWESGCYSAGERMFSLMFLLSFPGSLFYLVFLGVTFNSVSASTPFLYFLIWGGAFAVGYFQWFGLLPYLLDRPEMTTLGLGLSGASNVSRTGSGRCSSSRRRRRRRRAAWLRGARVIHFDETGRTPLERVINNHQAAG
jgi:hypothetical protein